MSQNFRTASTAQLHQPQIPSLHTVHHRNTPDSTSSQTPSSGGGNNYNNNNYSNQQTATYRPMHSGNNNNNIILPHQQQFLSVAGLQQHQQLVAVPQAQSICNAQIQPPSGIYMTANPAGSGLQQHNGQVFPAIIPTPLQSNYVTWSSGVQGYTYNIHGGDLQADPQGSTLMHAIPVSMPMQVSQGGSVGSHTTHQAHNYMQPMGPRTRRSRLRNQGRRGDNHMHPRHVHPQSLPTPLENTQSTVLTHGRDSPIVDQGTHMQFNPTSFSTSSYASQGQAQNFAAFPAYQTAYYAPQPTIPLQSPNAAAAQQATGQPLLVAALPMFPNGQQAIYNYMSPYVIPPPPINQTEYPYSESTEECPPQPVDEPLSNPPDGMVWHPQQQVYTDEYGVTPADIQAAVAIDEMTNGVAQANSGQLVSPNYSIYDPQHLHDMQHQLGVMHLYEGSPLQAIESTKADFVESGAPDGGENEIFSEENFLPNSGKYEPYTYAATQTDETVSNKEQGKTIFIREFHPRQPLQQDTQTMVQTTTAVTTKTTTKVTKTNSFLTTDVDKIIEYVPKHKLMAAKAAATASLSATITTESTIVTTATAATSIKQTITYQQSQVKSSQAQIQNHSESIIIDSETKKIEDKPKTLAVEDNQKTQKNIKTTLPIVTSSINVCSIHSVPTNSQKVSLPPPKKSTASVAVTAAPISFKAKDVNVAKENNAQRQTRQFGAMKLPTSPPAKTSSTKPATVDIASVASLEVERENRMILERERKKIEESSIGDNLDSNNISEVTISTSSANTDLTALQMPKPSTAVQPQSYLLKTYQPLPPRPQRNRPKKYNRSSPESPTAQEVPYNITVTTADNNTQEIKPQEGLSINDEAMLNITKVTVETIVAPTPSVISIEKETQATSAYDVNEKAPAAEIEPIVVIDTIADAVQIQQTTDINQVSSPNKSAQITQVGPITQTHPITRAAQITQVNLVSKVAKINEAPTPSQAASQTPTTVTTLTISPGSPTPTIVSTSPTPSSSSTISSSPTVSSISAVSTTPVVSTTIADTSTSAVSTISAVSRALAISTTSACSTTSTAAVAPVATATLPVSSAPKSWASLFSAKPSANNLSRLNSTAAKNVNKGNASNSAITKALLTTSQLVKKPIAKSPLSEQGPSATTSQIETTPSPKTTGVPGVLSYSATSAKAVANAEVTSAPSATVPAPFASCKILKQREGKIRRSSVITDELADKYAHFIIKYRTELAPISLRPRGLTNRSNYCYINSILQALVGCGPLYHLLRAVPKNFAAMTDLKAPTINAMIAFMNNFSSLSFGLRLRAPPLRGNRRDDVAAADLQSDPAFEPSDIYKLWNDSRSEHTEDRQEDAEEFLSYVLNKLNDEMLELVKVIKPKAEVEQNGEKEEEVDDGGDSWQMICNNRNKGSIIRQSDFGRTPISDIFRGELRSRLQREGEHPTDVIQPFYTLQLNIEKADSVKEALEILVGRDQLEGVTGSKTKQEVIAWQQMTLEKLPMILIMHLKCFDYRADGCNKLLKKVDFPIELRIDPKILGSKKYSQRQRIYRLFAVVYHEGKEATKGHYMADVFHSGYNHWLRFDDSSVKPVSENHVLVPRTPRVPYLLYYRRSDTIQPTPTSSSEIKGFKTTHTDSY